MVGTEVHYPLLTLGFHCIGQEARTLGPYWCLIPMRYCDNLHNTQVYLTNKTLLVTEY